MPSDVAKFSQDRSGGAVQPRIGSDGVPPPEKRIWYAMHRMYDEGLLGAHPVKAFSASFQTFFGQQLASFPAGEWADEVQIFEFLKQNMSIAATRAVLGTRMLDDNPDFVDAFWQYEKFVETLAFGLPKWLNRRGVRARNRFRAMCVKWYEVADREFDWDGIGPDKGPDWEPVFGSRISRGLAQWAKSFDFSTESIGAAYALFHFG